MNTTPFSRLFDTVFDRMETALDGLPESGISGTGGGLSKGSTHAVSKDGRHSSITVDIPGLNHTDVAVDLADGILTINAKRGTRRIHREFQLGGTVDGTDIMANVKDGVLTITVPYTKGRHKPGMSIKVNPG